MSNELPVDRKNFVARMEKEFFIELQLEWQLVGSETLSQPSKITFLYYIYLFNLSPGILVELSHSNSLQL